MLHRFHDVTVHTIELCRVDTIQVYGNVHRKNSHRLEQEEMPMMGERAQHSSELCKRLTC